MPSGSSSLIVQVPYLDRAPRTVFEDRLDLHSDNAAQYIDAIRILVPVARISDILYAPEVLLVQESITYFDMIRKSGSTSLTVSF